MGNEHYYERKESGICAYCGREKATHGILCESCYEKRKPKPEAQPPNYNCYWYQALARDCGILTCLQCARGKCSFYETTQEYEERQRKYNNTSVM